MWLEVIAFAIESSANQVVFTESPNPQFDIAGN